MMHVYAGYVGRCRGPRDACILPGQLHEEGGDTKTHCLSKGWEFPKEKKVAAHVNHVDTQIFALFGCRYN